MRVLDIALGGVGGGGGGVGVGFEQGDVGDVKIAGDLGERVDGALLADEADDAADGGDELVAAGDVPEPDLGLAEPFPDPGRDGRQPVGRRRRRAGAGGRSCGRSSVCEQVMLTPLANALRQVLGPRPAWRTVDTQKARRVDL